MCTIRALLSAQVAPCTVLQEHVTLLNMFRSVSDQQVQTQFSASPPARSGAGTAAAVVDTSAGACNLLLSGSTEAHLLLQATQLNITRCKKRHSSHHKRRSVPLCLAILRCLSGANASRLLATLRSLAIGRAQRSCRNYCNATGRRERQCGYWRIVTMAAVISKGAAIAKWRRHRLVWVVLLRLRCRRRQCACQWHCSSTVLLGVPA